MYLVLSSCLPVPIEDIEEREAASESESPGGAGCSFTPVVTSRQVGVGSS